MAATVENLLEGCRTRGDSFGVGFFDQIVEGRVFQRLRQLVDHLTPHRVDGDARQVCRSFDIVWIQSGTDKDCNTGFGKVWKFCRCDHLADFRHIRESYLAVEQVIERQHGVGLSSTECRFQFDDRISSIQACDLLQGFDEQRLDAAGEIGAPEEFDRILVFEWRGTLNDLCQIGGKFCVLVPSFRYIRVWRHHFTPGAHASCRHGLWGRNCFPDDHHLPFCHDGPFFASITHEPHHFLQFVGRCIVDGIAHQRHVFQCAGCFVVGEIYERLVGMLVAEV